MSRYNNSRHEYLVEIMAKAMVKRSGQLVDDMRPSTWAKWKQFAEAGLAALSDEVADMKVANPPTTKQPREQGSE